MRDSCAGPGLLCTLRDTFSVVAEFAAAHGSQRLTSHAGARNLRSVASASSHDGTSIAKGETNVVRGRVMFSVCVGEGWVAVFTVIPRLDLQWCPSMNVSSIAYSHFTLPRNGVGVGALQSPDSARPGSHGNY